MPLYSSFVPSTNYGAPSSVPYPHRSAPINIDSLDAETDALIARVTLEDLEEFYQGHNRNGRQDLPSTDEEVAYRMQVAHYQEMLAAAEDPFLAKSIADSVNTEEAYLNAFIIPDEVQTQDTRRVDRSSAVIVISDDEDVSDDDSDWSIIDGFSDFGDSDLHSVYEDLDQCTPSSPLSSAVSNRPSSIVSGKRPAVFQPKIQNVDCTICTDRVRIDKALKMSCDHYYCKTCVVALVEAFTRDESLFPLRCCGKAIPSNDVIPFLDGPLARLFNEKHAEFSVSCQNRVYCVSPQCSNFLGSSEGVIEAGMVCPSCFTSTCPKCKQSAHQNEGCGDSTSMVALRALASEYGWQTCPGCDTVVELSSGCFHMTCRCRTQFCYLCAVPWKQCACPQWDEPRKIASAQQRVENELGARATERTAPSIVQRRFEEILASLTFNHAACDRHLWRYRAGEGKCDSCDSDFPQFLLLCRCCSMLACVRCTRNRL